VILERGLESIDPCSEKSSNNQLQLDKLTCEVAEIRKMVKGLASKSDRSAVKNKSLPTLFERDRTSIDIPVFADDPFIIKPTTPEGLTDDDLANLLDDDIDKIVKFKECAIDKGGYPIASMTFLKQAVINNRERLCTIQIFTTFLQPSKIIFYWQIVSSDARSSQ
jgi:hypothetical protein